MAVQWQPLAAVLLTPYLVGNVVSSLLLTTSWLTQMTSPPSSRESTISPMGGKRLPLYTSEHSFPTSLYSMNRLSALLSQGTTPSSCHADSMLP